MIRWCPQLSLCRPKVLRALGFCLLGGFVVVLGTLHFGTYFLGQWLEAKFARYGLEAQVGLGQVGFSGAEVEALQLKGPGLHASAQDLSLDWQLWQLMGGRLDGIDIGLLELTLDLRDEALFSRLAQPPGGWGQTPPITQASFLPLRWQAPRALPESGWLDYFWAAPFERFSAPKIALGMDFGGRSTGLGMAVAYDSDNTLHRLQAQGSGVDFDFQFSLEGQRQTQAWTSQVSWKGRHVLDLWDKILPPEHAQSVAKRFGSWLQAWELSDLELEAFVRGQDAQLVDYSILLNQGPAWVRLHTGQEFQTKAISAGLTKESSTIKQAEIVVDFENIYLLGGHTRPFKANISGAAGRPLRIELPSVRWSRPGEVEIDLALRAFMTPETGTTELQFAVSKAAYGQWVLQPFRWFTTLSPLSLSSRFSRLSLERFPDWGLAGSQFEDSGGGAYRFETTLEFLPSSTKALHLSGTFASGQLNQPEGAVKLADGRGQTLGAFRYRTEAEGLAVEGEGACLLGALSASALGEAFSVDDLEISGDVEWRVDGRPHRLFYLQAQARLKLSDLHLRSRQGDWVIDGLEALLHLKSVGFFPASEGVQAIHIDRLQFGPDVLEEVRLRFAWPSRDNLRIEELSGKWLGGSISIKPFELVFRDDRVVETLVVYSGLQAERLFAGKASPAQSSERVSGEVKLALQIPGASLGFSGPQWLILLEDLKERIRQKAALALTEAP